MTVAEPLVDAARQLILSAPRLVWPARRRFLRMDMELRVEARSSDECVVVTPVGDVDLSNVARLREALHEQYLRPGADVVVDLDHVTFIDSAGLGVLIGARRRAYVVHGSLTLVCSQSRILRIFEITRLDRVFDVVSKHPAVEAR